jgi:hypothetical protein
LSISRKSTRLVELETPSPAPGDATPAPGNGKTLALAVGVVGNIPLFVASVVATKPVECGPESRGRFDASALVGWVILGFLFLVGYAAYGWLARRFWSRGWWAKVVCLLPLLATTTASILLAAVALMLTSGVLC